MEKTDNSAYWLAFASIEEVGAAFIRKVYEHFGSIKSAWCAGCLLYTSDAADEL